MSGCITPQNLNWLNHATLCNLQDNFSDSRQGHWFGKHPKNSELFSQHSILSHLTDDVLERLSSRDPDSGALSVKQHVVLKMMQNLNKIQMDLLVAIHMTCGMPARGPEIARLLFCNSALVAQNVFITNGQVCIVTTYHKGQSMSQKSWVICCFLPFHVGRLVVYLLMILRPACKVFFAAAGL